MDSKKQASLRQLIILLCAVVLLIGALYTASWYASRSRIQNRNETYSQIYLSDIATPSPDAAGIQLPAVADNPLPTPDANTIVIQLPTAPPVQSSFSELLSINPETIGFLQIDELVSLPVVQRENDNDFYLRHNFELAESAEGTLFLDGMNRLVPEDECLILYGHNMNNGTMFGELDHYDELSFLKRHPLVQFDTIYANHTYVPFAVFPASMNPESGSYFDVRQIAFSADTFDLFISSLKRRSVLDIPVDAYYGDSLLLLVTCDYTKDDGRFIVALRRLRGEESPGEAAALVMDSRN